MDERRKAIIDQPESIAPISGANTIISGIFRRKSQNPQPSDRLPFTEVERLLNTFHQRKSKSIDIFHQELGRLTNCRSSVIHSDHIEINGRFEPLIETMIEENDDGTVTLFIPLAGHTVEIRLDEIDFKNLVEEKWESFRILIKITTQEMEKEDQSYQQIDIFTTTVHDVRNKISITLNNIAYVLEQETILPEESISALGDAMDATLAAERIAAKSLAILVSERNALRLERKKINMASLLSRVIAPYRGKCAVMNKSGTMNLLADAIHLERLLDNLIGNAMKYGEGQNKPVVIEVENDNHDLTIRVIDRGPGLGENPNRLFEFYARKTDKEQKIDGFGIGLGYCKLICRLHDGSIEAQNNPDGVGSAFTVKLPLERS